MPQRVALHLLAAYKRLLSPMFPPACRYVPTCSEYAMEAIDRFGILRGTAMSLWRLLRCHPFAHGGYDPVERGSSSLGMPRFSPSLREVGFTTADDTHNHRIAIDRHGNLRNS